MVTGDDNEHPPEGFVAVSMSTNFHDQHEKRIIHVRCKPTKTLGDLRRKLCKQRTVECEADWMGWVEWTRDKNFYLRGCTLPDEVTIGALELEPDDVFQFQHKQNDCRPLKQMVPQETIEQSVQRLRKVREARWGYKERLKKAYRFNELIERTKSELTMSDADCRNIICLLVEGQGTLTILEAVKVVLDNSRNYLSSDQAFTVIRAFTPDDNMLPGMTDYLNRFADWMGSFMLNSRPCVFQRDTVVVQPPPDVLGMPGYSAAYYGLQWTRDYTYTEARPLIAKSLISYMGRWDQWPSGPCLPVGAPLRPADDWVVPEDVKEVIDTLDKRAHLRSEAMRRWGRLIKLAPLVGRWALVLKPWYNEVSLKPEIGSVWQACRERFEGMQTEPERDVRQRVE